MSLNKFDEHGTLTAELTDSSGGTASTTNTIVASDSTTNDAANWATVTAKLNTIIAALNKANT